MQQQQWTVEVSHTVHYHERIKQEGDALGGWLCRHSQHNPIHAWQQAPDCLALDQNRFSSCSPTSQSCALPAVFYTLIGYFTSMKRKTIGMRGLAFQKILA
jgi:hypothetical protein